MDNWFHSNVGLTKIGNKMVEGAIKEKYGNRRRCSYFGDNYFFEIEVHKYTLPSGEVYYEAPEGFSGSTCKDVYMFLQGHPETRWGHSHYEWEW